MTRWRIVGTLAVATLVLAGALAGAAAKDTLVVGAPIEPAGLDPTVAAPVAIREITWGNVFEGLTTLDQDGAVQPLLAKDWSVSADGLAYTFRLRDKVTFHNGTPFDSGIVKFSLDRARAPQSTNAQKQFFEPIEAIDTPDPLTAVIRLKHPVGLLLYRLAWGDAVMVEPGTIETNRTAPVGTGPFMFKAWQRGDHIDLVRNPAYWQAGTPKLAAVTFRFIGDPQAEAAALRAGDVDAFLSFSAPELFGDFQKDSRFKAVAGATPGKVVAGLNNARAPFADVRVRRAMMSAIDRKAVIEGAYAGFGTPIGSHYAPSDQGYVDLTGVLPFDPAKARALLTEAGYPNGFALTIKVPQMAYATRSAEILQAMLGDVGIAVTLVPTEFPARWIDEVFLRKDFDMTIVDHAEPMDIDIYARPSYYFGYRNPAFDRIVAAAERESGTAERDRLYGAAETILAEDVPALYLFDVPRLGIWDARLSGFRINESLPQMVVKDVSWTR